MDNISWKIIDTYFNDNPDNLVKHHLDSYNDFFSNGIIRVFKENNPIRFIEREEIIQESSNNKKKQNVNEILLYLGGKDGKNIYFGKPIIYDDNSKRVHYMYPNDARLRNMWYGTTIHYDVDVVIIYYIGDERKEKNITLNKIYLGKFPIMLQSKLCVLNSLSPEVRFNMGECRNDYGGYFIISGKEKVIISQEEFASNALYIRKHNKNDIFSHSASIRSISEDTSKPMRTTSIKIIRPTSSFTNNQIVVDIPNVRKEIPLFILMRALGVNSDKDIIKMCLLDLEQNSNYVDLFIPSIHDANRVLTQQSALKLIATFTKRKTVSSAIEILTNYFLPHVGDLNFLEKAYFVGYMVKRMLRVFTEEEKPTDRDNFRYKRVKLSGTLIYELFREYYLIQLRTIALKLDKEFYFHRGKYKEDDFVNLIELNYNDYFKQRDVESGFLKAFKGNWGASTYTKRIGVVQDLNRLSWNTFISQLRKINLPLDSSAKVIGPRLLNSSQWGFIDPLDTPDGANIGLHKHLSISAFITSGTSSYPIIKWLRTNANMKLLLESSPEELSINTKIIVNGKWCGSIDNPIELVDRLKLLRRNGVIPIFTSISFDSSHNELNIYSDDGRLTRPIYYIDKGKPSFIRDNKIIDMLYESPNWGQIISGFNKKKDINFNAQTNKLYELNDLYDNGTTENLYKYKSLVDYVDTSEEENALIAMNEDELKLKKHCTHVEIKPSLILGVMGNLIIYPENNPIARNAFSCGQSKQAVSLYHSNYQMRIDKMGVVLSYGQTPLIKSRYLEYINKEQQPYGINAIVAIMSYTGYNVEDAILINEGSVKRGIFRTTYYSMYESHEETTDNKNSKTNSRFSNIQKHNVVGIKAGYDYSLLDDSGMIKENTPLNDKIVVIGKITSNPENKDKYVDSSVTLKKGQLGFIDKTFITEGETGTKLAKVRIREERIPAIGDKMASRAGQKGTLGLIIPEENMPFTSDGIRPDLIINPHAIPSRMTIGQLLESLFGKACASYGAYGDCTAFDIKGSNTKLYGKMLTNIGFHSSGNQLLYNGMTGEQLQSDIFIGPTYYMRLKHMVKDKINYRALGPRTSLTRQTVQGRANDGGLRIGEMERDGILAHGASYFLNESFLVRGDEYYMAVCNKTGTIAIYNDSKNLFLSPFVDGPIQFKTNPDGSKNIKSISRFGRSFSIVKIPYALKLLIQELQVMNIQMRIITDTNVDQLISMSYSDNYKLLLKTDETDIKKIIQDYTSSINSKINNKIVKIPEEVPELPDNVQISENESPQYPDVSPAFNPESPQYPDVSPAFNPESPQYPDVSPAFNPESPQYPDVSPAFNPESPQYPDVSPAFNPESPQYPDVSPAYSESQIIQNDFGSNEINNFFNNLPKKSQNMILELNNKRDQKIILTKLLNKNNNNENNNNTINGTEENTKNTENQNKENPQLIQNDFGSNELNNFFNNLSKKSQNMILELNNKRDQKIILTKLLNKNNNSITDIFNVNENNSNTINGNEENDQNKENQNEENDENKTKQIIIK
jgi:DNA-directed RNA polymerase II subunit RPB2